MSRIIIYLSILILSSYVLINIPSGLFLSGSYTKTSCVFLLSLLCSACSHLILFDVTTLPIFNDEYELGSVYCWFNLLLKD
jgi:hypothetical protein